MTDPDEKIEGIAETEKIERREHPDFFNDPVEEIPEKKRRKKWWFWLILLLILIFLLFILYLLDLSNTATKIFLGRRPNPLTEIKNIIGPDMLKGENEGDINVLFVGMRGDEEEYPYATNAITLVNYDANKEIVNTISFSRDMLVPVKGEPRKVNSICELAGAKPLDCTGLATEVFENVTGLKIHYTFIADFNGYIDIIDDTQRIDVNLKGKAGEYPFLKDKEFDSARDINPEIFHLNGAQSLIFVRWPKDVIPDFGRIERQQIFLSAASEQILSPSLILNPVKLKSVLEIGAEHLRTNFQLWEILKFSNLVKGASINKYSLNTDLSAKGGLLKATGRSDHSLASIDGENNFDSIHKFFNTIVAEN